MIPQRRYLIPLLLNRCHSSVLSVITERINNTSVLRIIRHHNE